MASRRSSMPGTKHRKPLGNVRPEPCSDPRRCIGTSALGHPRENALYPSAAGGTTVPVQSRGSLP